MDMKFYWKLVLRRLPVMVALFLLCSGIGFAVAVKLPTTYQSSARLLLETPRIPTNLAASTVQTSAAEEVELVRQQLLTRANLIDIANKFRVFGESGTMSPDDIVAAMRRQTRFDVQRVSTPRGTPAPVLASISFTAGTAQTAAAVVNEYVTRITETNVRDRTGRAGDTLQFFEQEAARLGAELDQRSARISEYQSANPNSLPGSLDRQVSRQTVLNERIAVAIREKTSIEEQRQRIVSVFEATGQVPGGSGRVQLSPAATELARLEAELSSALTIYSESNPRITTLKTRIEQVRVQVAAESGVAAGSADPAQALLELQLSEIDQRIAAIDTEVATAEAELGRLEAAMAETPQKMIALETMERDYANVRGQYDRAVASLAQARLGERIEFSSRGQRISLIEPGTVPNAPSSPNRPLIAAMGVGAGLALAAAYFLLLEVLNRTVRRPAELTRALGIAPLATIPYIETVWHRRVRRSLRLAALAVVMVGVPAALWAVDTYYLPLDLLVSRLLGRIGLA